MQAREVMTREVVTVGPDTSAKYAAEVMAERGFAAVPVVDEENRLVGIVAEADVLRDRLPGDPRLHALRGDDLPETPPQLLVRGVMTEHIMQAVSREMFGGDQGRALIEQTLPQVQGSTMPDDQKRLLVEMLGSVQKFYNQSPSRAGGSTVSRGITMPYTVHEEAMTAGSNVAYNGYAHSFAGMAIQFLLFAMANIGVEMLLERQRGLWSRLRSAPISKVTLLAGKAASGTLISLMILLVSFGFAMVVFGVRIQGSAAGFLAISLACAVMGFPLLVRSIRLSIDAVDRRLEDAAGTLGANALWIFLTVTLPLIVPGIIAGMILSFARALGEFGATITFVSNIPGETQTLPTAIYTLIQTPGGDLAALRLTLVSIVISMLALFASEALIERATRRALGL